MSLDGIKSTKRTASGGDLIQRATQHGDWILLGADDRGNGTSMEYYGVMAVEDTTADTQPTRTLEGRGTQCSATPTPSCDTKHNQAQNSLCSYLLDNLSAQSTLSVDPSWRQICYRGTDGSCCTGWNEAVSKLQQGDLADNVQILSEYCSANGVSGKIYGTKLYNTCVNLCVNSGHRCS
ncbi:hypothetical protein GGR57DRAFT_515519 [Xylariaceae sp. FL1272]|nr:hypothetical protein GGR57DRAFT_515519 [Xylariaceae sp. FL1272]